MSKNTACLVALLIVISGCGGGGGDSTPPIEAPCDLMYSIPFLSIAEGELLNPLIPTVGCGAVADWSVTPVLPGGLTISPIDGTISGTPTTAGTDDFYIVTASNVTGTTSFSLRIQVNPPPPCNLVYPLSFVMAPAGVALTPQIPTVDCGPVATWQVSPLLPEGLLIDATDGTIFGAAITDGYDEVHLITAANAGGSTLFNLRIRIDPIFTFKTSPTTGTYSGITGEGSVSLGLALVEDSVNPTFPTSISGFNLAIAHEEFLLTVVSIGPSAVVQALNGGAGPTFWFQDTQGAEVVIASIFSFSFPVVLMQFDTEQEVALVDYATVPAAFINQAGPVLSNFEWVLETPLTPTTNDILVVTELAQGVVPLTIDAEVPLVRSD